MRVLAILAAALILAACSFPKMDPAAEALAKKAYVQLAAGEDAALAAEFEPQYRGPKSLVMFAQMRGLIPQGPAPAPKFAGFNSYAGTGGSTLTLTYTYEYPQSLVTAQTTLTKGKGKDGGWLIRGFNINVNAGEVAPAPAQPPPSAPRPSKPRPVA